MPKHVDLNAYRGQQIEDRGIVLAAGERSFTIPPPVLWPEEAIRLIGVDAYGVARAVLGDEYDAFIAAGGTGPLLMRMVEEQEQIAAGESPAS